MNIFNSFNYYINAINNYGLSKQILFLQKITPLIIGMVLSRSHLIFYPKFSTAESMKNRRIICIFCFFRIQHYAAMVLIFCLALLTNFGKLTRVKSGIQNRFLSCRIQYYQSWNNGLSNIFFLLNYQLLNLVLTWPMSSSKVQ